MLNEKNEIITQDEHLLRHKHDRLRNLQGGSSPQKEYYHLTLCQHGLLVESEFTDLHKHPHHFTTDLSDNIVPREAEAFRMDENCDLVPYLYDVDDPFYEKDGNGDIMPKGTLPVLICV
jgi:hypothetical protein